MSHEQIPSNFDPSQLKVHRPNQPEDGHWIHEAYAVHKYAVPNGVYPEVTPKTHGMEYEEHNVGDKRLIVARTYGSVGKDAASAPAQVSVAEDESSAPAAPEAVGSQEAFFAVEDEGDDTPKQSTKASQPAETPASAAPESEPATSEAKESDQSLKIAVGHAEQLPSGELKTILNDETRLYGYGSEKAMDIINGIYNDVHKRVGHVSLENPQQAQEMMKEVLKYARELLDDEADEALAAFNIVKVEHINGAVYGVWAKQGEGTIINDEADEIYNIENDLKPGQEVGCTILDEDDRLLIASQTIRLDSFSPEELENVSDEYDEQVAAARILGISNAKGGHDTDKSVIVIDIESAADSTADQPPADLDLEPDTHEFALADLEAEANRIGSLEIVEAYADLSPQQIKNLTTHQKYLRNTLQDYNKAVEGRDFAKMEHYRQVLTGRINLFQEMTGEKPAMFGDKSSEQLEALDRQVDVQLTKEYERNQEIAAKIEAGKPRTIRALGNMALQNLMERRNKKRGKKSSTEPAVV